MVDRRTYLKGSGAAILGLTAGCLTQQGGGGGNETTTDGGGNGTPTEAGNETGGNATNETGGGGGGGEQEIVAGTAPGFPPFEMKQGGDLVGFDVDLLTAVVEAADGYTLSGWQEYEFKSLIPALTSNKIDVIAAALTINDERDQSIDFSNPYYNADQSVLVREGGDFQPSALEDLSEHGVGAQQGTTGEQVVQSQLIDQGTLSAANYKSYGNYVLAVQDLENGNIDAVVLDKPVAETFADQRAVEVAFTVETGERYGFGVRNGDDQLVAALNDGLEQVRQDGTYEELRNEWFGDQAGSGGNATGNATGNETGNATGNSTA